MKRLPYKDVSAKDLSLNLIQGEVNLDDLLVISEARLKTNGLEIKFGIIGASHYCQFILGENCLQEVFACVEVHTETRRLFFGPVSAIPTRLETVAFGNLGYSFKADVVSCRTGEVRLSILESKITESENDEGETTAGLRYTFPSETSDEQFPPQTLVYVQVNEAGDNVVLETAHVYSNENTVVFTCTEVHVRH